MIAPSGEQITITAGDQQAVVVEVGGGLANARKIPNAVLDSVGEVERQPTATIRGKASSDRYVACMSKEILVVVG